MKIALCQFDMKWEDKPANKNKVSSLLESCPQKGTLDWVIFPEMTLTGFSMDKSKTSLNDEDLEFFSSLARKHSSCLSFGGTQNGRNNLITVDKTGKVISSYSKIHLYSFGGEHTAYQAGTQRERFYIEGLRVLPAVCFDLRFPYLFWNAAEHVELLAIIASWPARRAEHWMTLLRARAIENQCYVIGVNRTGKDPQVEYSGNSMIYDPLGKVVLDCKNSEGLFVAEADVNKELVTQTRTRFPFFKDRLDLI